MADPLTPCVVHEMANCAICNPPAPTYRRGQPTLDVPAGHFVEIKGGKGVYHHPDCYPVTGEWEGSDVATLGERVIRSPREIPTQQLRPTQCCAPPTVPS
jgi:hypothetical protein